MIRCFAVSLLLLSACTEPPEQSYEAIIGATLVEGPARLLERSVVIVKGPFVAALGSQQSTPIPPDAHKVDASGFYLAPARQGAALKVGAAADFVLLKRNPLVAPDAYENAVVRRMKAGRWQDAER